MGINRICRGKEGNICGNTCGDTEGIKGYVGGIHVGIHVGIQKEYMWVVQRECRGM